MVSILTQKLALYKLHLLLLAALLCSLGYLFHLLQPQPRPVLPPVPPPLPLREEKMTSVPAVQMDLPQRDPFLPLNHPQRKNEEQSAAFAAVTPSEKITIPVPPPEENVRKQSAPAPIFRFCGLLTVNGKRKALILTPAGSLLLGEGETLPGKGQITELKEQSLQCKNQSILLGESWS